MSSKASAQSHKMIFSRPPVRGCEPLFREFSSQHLKSASSVNVNFEGNKRNINIETRGVEHSTASLENFS